MSGAFVGVARVLARLAGAGEIVEVEGVRYHRRRARRRGKPGERRRWVEVYDVEFPGGGRMRITPSPVRRFDDLTPGPRAVAAAAAVDLVPPGSRVLDVGCGTGASAAQLARVVGPSGSVLAVDADAESIRFARRRYRAGNLGFEGGAVEALSGEADGAFDAALVDGEIAASYAAELLRVVAPPGPLLIVTGSAGEQGAMAAMSAAADERGLVVQVDRPWRGGETSLVRLRLSPEGAGGP